MKKLLKFLGDFTIETFVTISIYSFEILLGEGLIALTLSIFGWKKGKDIGTMAPAIYIILRIIARVICDVRY